MYRLRGPYPKRMEPEKYSDFKFLGAWNACTDSTGCVPLINKYEIYNAPKQDLLELHVIAQNFGMGMVNLYSLEMDIKFYLG